jgi:tetratricopeptide (TPR) repeat protein/SAM-dependent methyltransferase
LAKLSVDRALLKAKFHAKKGENEEAQKLYQAVLRAFPKNKRAQQGLTALSKAKQSVAMEGPSQDVINQLINFYNQGQLPAAVEQATALTRQYPEASIFWNILGMAAAQIGREGQALLAFEKMILLEPDNADAHNNLGNVLKSQGKLDEAIGAYNKALSLKSDFAEAYNNMGATLKGQGKLDEAIEAYNNALTLKPDYAEAYNNMGTALYDQGKMEKTIEACNNALTLKPDYAEAYNNIGNALKDQGQLDDAIAAYRKALSLKPNYAEFYNNIGIALQEQSKLEEAIEAYTKAFSIQPDFADAYYNMGIALQDQGKLEEAVEAYNKALLVYDRPLKPGNSEAFNNMGNALKEQDRLEEAVEAYNKAISLKPDNAEAFNNIGNALKEQGKLEVAIEAYNKALSINPDYSDAFNNMGNALKEQDRLEEAIEVYNKAIWLKPDNAEAFNNMGNALREQDKLEEAIEAYNKALSLKPDNAEAFNNMGITLKEQGKLEEAIESYTKALALKPDYTDTLYNISVALKSVRFKRFNSSVESAIISILDCETMVRPSDIAGAVVSLLKCTPTIKDLFSVDFSTSLGLSFDETILALSDNPLLLKIMSVSPLADLDLERTLYSIQSHILSNISELSRSSDLLKVQSALALHCFTNEYIYDLTGRDAEALKNLETLVAGMLSDGNQPNPHMILCLGSFKALHGYDWSQELQINPDIEDVFKRQIADPKDENRLKSEVTVLEEITDKVSTNVRNQYEENPYPRWVNLGLSYKPETISKVVKDAKLKLSNVDITSVDTPDILIAGCGTGQHSIGTAYRFKDSKVLAIDLSLTSLAYAKRKTQQLGFHNIDYMQADILKLNKLDRQFDLIESSGVLHHMDDPMAGWRVLVDCLKPGGIMKIGLYSELARQPVVKFRADIAQSGSAPTKSNIRAMRERIIASEDGLSKELRSWNDFYSMSELRDLIFHAQEHRFTLPQIKDCLKQLGLQFCGFEADQIVDAFTASEPEKDAVYDLDKWNTFEEANPRIFAGMYQFWCQKTS